MRLNGRSECCWVDTLPPYRNSRYRASAATGVAVVGGGIVGLTTALLLARAGRRVTVLEARTVGHGVTGRSTAKITSQHTLIYASLIRTSGDGACAPLCGRERRWRQNGPATRRRAWHRVRSRAKGCLRVHASAGSTQCAGARSGGGMRAGLAGGRRGTCAAAVRERGRRSLSWSGAVQPRALSRRAGKRHSRRGRAGVRQRSGDKGRQGSGEHPLAPGSWKACTSTRTTSSSRPTCRSGRRVRSTAARSRAVTSRWLFGRVAGWRSMACSLVSIRPPIRCAWGAIATAPSPWCWGRNSRRATTKMSLADSRGSRRGPATISTWAPWRGDGSTRITIRPTGCPSPARCRRVSGGLFVATGFGGWGISNGTAAAMLIADQLLERPNAWASLYDPSRRTPEHFNRGGDSRSMTRSVEDIMPGEGGVVVRGRQKIALWKSADGTPHALSASCTHAGCTVTWNNAALTWDCPCHGSMFSREGDVLHGPATKPLKPVRMPARRR